ncbi:MAG: isoamylase early set domain-containing protein [Endomicrobiales bacterium]
MNCKKIRLVIDEMADKGKAESAAPAREHMKTCKDCTGYHAFWSAQKGASPARAPEGIKYRIMERVAAGGMKPSWSHSVSPYLRYAAPSAVLASLLMFFAVWMHTARTTVPVTFKISYENARTIALAGDFNGWKSDEVLLVKKGDVWEATVRLKPRRYQYMFVVDGEKFVPDPEAQLYVDDGFGQKNSVIDITGA